MACCSDTGGLLESEYWDDADTVSTSGRTRSNFSASTISREGTVNDNKSRGGSVAATKMSHQIATPLFQAVEREDWEGILTFLTTSKWSSGFFASSTDHLSSPTPAIQCQTWVTAYDADDRKEWSQLPLHAAICYEAPEPVVQKLLDMYPDALHETDGEGMLPIHLAFAYAASDAVILLLVKPFPECLQQKGPEGRLPHECCDLGRNKVRGEVYGMLAKQTAITVNQDHENVWKTCVRENMVRLKLDEDEKIVEEKQLSELLTELLEDRKQLRYLKQKLKKKYSSVSKPVDKLEENLDKSPSSPKSSILMRGKNSVRGPFTKNKSPKNDKTTTTTTTSNLPANTSLKTYSAHCVEITATNNIYNTLSDDPSLMRGNECIAPTYKSVESNKSGGSKAAVVFAAATSPPPSPAKNDAASITPSNAASTKSMPKALKLRWNRKFINV